MVRFNLKVAKKVMLYRLKGLSIREIGVLMKKDPKQIRRYMKYALKYNIYA